MMEDWIRSNMGTSIKQMEIEKLDINVKKVWNALKNIENVVMGVVKMSPEEKAVDEW